MLGYFPFHRSGNPPSLRTKWNQSLCFWHCIVQLKYISSHACQYLVGVPVRTLQCIEPMRYGEYCFYLPNLCSFGDLAVAFEGDPLHCRSYIWYYILYIWYVLVDLTSIKNTLHEVSRKLIWETMFIYIKCNVSIKFNNGSSIVSITVACYKNKWFGKMAERSNAWIFCLWFPNICNIVEYIYKI